MPDSRRPVRLSHGLGIALAALPIAISLQGCLYTSHHFNTGQLVAPGKTRWEFGTGSQRLAETACSDVEGLARHQTLKQKAASLPNLRPQYSTDYYGSSSIKDRNGSPSCAVNYYAGEDTLARTYVVLGDTFSAEREYSALLNVSMGWRLGVRNAWGPFTGVDIGWRLEAPTGPATLEFDARFGLPLPVLMARWNHAASLGWGIGAWADNSLFAEYAFGMATGRLRPFGNTRVTYLASQPMDLAVSSGFTDFTRYRRWVAQANVGLEWILPDWPLLPQRLLPTLSLAYPALPFFMDTGHLQAEGVDIRLALGASWSL